jgi:hypothetical protein
MIVCSAPSVGAEVFRLAPWRGQLEAFVSLSHTDTSGGDTSDTSDTMNAQQLLTLRNRGAYFFDPRLVRLDIAGTFGLQQERLKTDTGDQSSDEFTTGDLWGYDLNAFIFPEEATSLLLFASRDQTSPPRFGAGTQEFINEDMGATLFLDRLYIPSRLQFRRELRKDDINVGGVLSLRDDTDITLEYDGERGWINSEMQIEYDFRDHTDNLSSGGDFQDHTGRMNYSLDFGSDLNWRWDSRLSTLYRTGDLPDLTRLTANELLQIRHTERLLTNYRYTLNYSSSGDDVNVSHAGGVTLRHRLYESLDTNVGVAGRYENQSNGTKKSIGSNLNFNYRKRISAEGSLTAGLGGGFSWQADKFDDTTASAIDEVHTVTFPVANPVQLDNPFVIESTVVVTKEGNGPLPPGCSPFSVPRVLTEGVDYTLGSAGTNLTQIDPISCTLTTPGLNPGDTISVDYQYTVPEESEFTTGTFAADISVQYPWIRAYATYSQQVQTLIEGDPGFLEDRRRSTIGTELSYSKKDLRANLRGEVEFFDSDNQAFNALRLNQFLIYTILPGMNLSVTANQGLANFSNPDDRKTREAALRATLNYNIGRGLYASAFVAVRGYDETDQDLDFTGEVGLGMTYTIRQLTIAPGVKFLNRRRGDTDTKDLLFTLKITRSF